MEGKGHGRFERTNGKETITDHPSHRPQRRTRTQIAQNRVFPCFISHGPAECTRTFDRKLIESWSKRCAYTNQPN